MAIIKRYKIKNKKKKALFQAQTPAKNAYLTAKNANTKMEAVIQHEEKNKPSIPSPQALFEQSLPEMYFSDCFKKYIREALPLVRRSSREANFARAFSPPAGEKRFMRL